MARDLLQIRRGNEIDLPTLAQGEMAFTLDTEQFFIGGLTGNVPLIKDIVIIKNVNSADDTERLQAIIDANPNKILLFAEKGDYNINATTLCPVTDGTDPSRAALFIDKPLEIMMVKGARLVHVGGESGYNNYAICVRSEDVVLNGVNIYGDRDNINSAYGVQANESRFKMLNCFTESLDGSPCVINGIINNILTDIEVRNNTFQNNGNTFFAVFASRVNFIGNMCYNVSEGVDFDKLVVDSVISNNVFDTFRSSGADAGIELNGCRNIAITGNTISNFVDGVLLNAKSFAGTDYRCENISVVGNTIKNSTGYGVLMGNTLLNGDDNVDCIINSNNITECTFDGIQIRGKRLTINGNIISKCSYGGISGVDKFYETVINGNTIAECDRYGMDFTGAENVIISNNILKDNNAQSGESGGPFPAIRINDGFTGSIISNIIKGLHDYGIRTSGTNIIILGSNHVQDAVNQEYRFSATTTLTTSGQNNGEFTGATNGNGNRVFYGTAIPSSSFASKVGDIIYNTAPTAGGSIGWVCTQAGTPGTWKTFGVIQP